MRSESQIRRYSATSNGQESGNKQSLANRLRDLAGRADIRLGSVLSRFAFLGHWKISLAITIAILLAVIVARYCYSSLTGFIAPDEAWYYDTFLLRARPVGTYRTVFHAVFLLFFYGVDSVWEFLLRGVLYSAIWAIGCVLMFFVILRRLKVPENVMSMIVLSLPLFPVFIVFVPTMLTETLSLFLALVGVYFCLRHVQDGRMADSLAAVIFFILAYKVREDYLLFVVGNIFLFLVLSVKRRSPATFALYAAIIVLVFPIPIQLEPLVFVQTITWVTTIVRAAGYEFPVLTTSFAVPIEFTRGSDLLRAIIVGLGYGFNPLFALFAILSLFAAFFDLSKGRSFSSLFLVLNAVWSFGAFIIPAGVILHQMGSALSLWTSSIVRTTHGALPSIIVFPSIYRRLRLRRVVALTLILLMLGSTQVGQLVSAFQRGLSVEPVDRFSLDYRAPAYRMYLIAKDAGNVLLFGGAHMREIRVYMAMLPDVTVVPVGTRTSRGALNETEFQYWLEQNWDAIFLYDDWYTTKVPVMVNAYPQFYSEILKSHQYPGYTVETLWIDGESYALRMIRVSDSIAGLPA